MRDHNKCCRRCYWWGPTKSYGEHGIQNGYCTIKNPYSHRHILNICYYDNGFQRLGIYFITIIQRIVYRISIIPKLYRIKHPKGE